VVSRVVRTVVFTVMLLLGVVPARAQEATPGTGALDLPDWVQTWISMQEDEDIHGFAALYTPDATYEVLGDGIMVHDLFSIKEIAGMLAANGNEFDIVPTAFYAGDGWAVLEYSMGWDNVTVDKTQVRDVRTATIFLLNEEGLITRSSDYFDGLTVSEQSGYMLVEGAPAP
jgi:hypothetical protein